MRSHADGSADGGSYYPGHMADAMQREEAAKQRNRAAACADGRKKWEAMQMGLQMAAHIILGIWRHRKSDLEVHHG